MFHQRLDAHMISASYDIEAFLRAVEKKEYLEIISAANREATAAWRSAYQQRKSGEAADVLPSQYEHDLGELISFLRAAVTYRPLRVSEEIFDRFVQLRLDIAL